MIAKRIIPVLLHDSDGLVKTKRFKDPVYVGDPLNAVRIFNTKEVDELLLVDIGCSRDGVSPDFDLVSRVVSECFMPLGYGGGISNFEEARTILSLGVEKVILQSAIFEKAPIIEQISQYSGCQSVSIAIDVIQNRFAEYKVFHAAKRKILDIDLISLLLDLQARGAGEIFLTAVDREGTFSGYDLGLISLVKNLVDIPLVINGGASNIGDMELANKAGADAMAAGSMFIFYKNRDGVLLNYPTSANHINKAGDQI